MVGLNFFLEAVIETAHTAKEKFRKIVELTKKIDLEIMSLKVKFENARKVMDYFYDEPVSTRKKVSEALNIPISTINGVITELVNNGILVETTGYSRNQTFVFQEYIDIFLSEN